MGNGQFSMAEAYHLHQLVEECLGEISGIQQEGGMGCSALMTEEEFAKCLWWCTVSLKKSPRDQKKFSDAQIMAAHMIASFIYDHPNTNSVCCHKDALELIDWHNCPVCLDEWIDIVRKIVEFYS